MSNPSDQLRQDATPDIDVGMEEPSNDVLEQHRTDLEEDDLEDQGASSRPIEADDADVDEQRRGVPGEDERRGE